MKTESLPTPPPEAVHEAEAETNAIVARAREFRITTAAEYEAAGEFAGKIKTAQKRVDELFDGSIRAAKAAHTAALDAKRKLRDPLDRAEQAIKSTIGLYAQAEERRRRDEQRARDEQARREAEERRLSEAVHLEQSGRAAEAEAVLERPAPRTVVAPPPPAPAKPSNVSTVTIWRARVDDPTLVPREFLCVDETKLAQYARAMGETASVPGVVFWADTSTRVSGR